MHFATCEYGGKTFPCIIKEDFVIKLTSFQCLRSMDLSNSKDLLPFIAGVNDKTLELLKNDVESISVQKLEGMLKSEDVMKIKDVKLRAPLLRPPAVFCLGFNYRSHAPELNRSVPEAPIVFLKPSASVIGPEEEIILPRVSSRVDYEVELTIVMGKGGRYIKRSEAYERIFGYTVLNDITARDIQQRDFSLSRPWLRSKGFDTFAPIGPIIVTHDEIGDPMALDLELRINGEIKQKSNTKEMIFEVPTIVEYISSFTTLEPGSIIATGTPEKIGQLRDGDNVEAYIEKIGILKNKAVLERIQT
ncbi:MAG: fumarylacetoacetate hydrolase family protein [Candidatus Methanomethylicaceae archaeon]